VALYSIGITQNAGRVHTRVEMVMVTGGTRVEFLQFLKMTI